MSKPSKKRVFWSSYVSQNHLVIEGFEPPFSQNLDINNRRVKLAGLIPRDELANLYLKQNPIKPTGRLPLNPRVVIGALIIKHLCNLDDRETISQITENIYMQHFLGYSGFTQKPPFDASLFVEIRKRLGNELLNEMNLHILQLSKQEAKAKKIPGKPGSDKGNDDDRPHRGTLLMDATVSPHDIAYPTDLRLLNDARLITEKIIDYLHRPEKVKPRTYRKIAHKNYLQVAQNK